MSGEPMSDAELFPLFEAARWAPSSSNAQLWRFVYAKRVSVHWDPFFTLLNSGNQTWCKNASVLVILVSRTHKGDRPQKTFAFDAGSAWENLAVEGTRKGYVVHAMAGFDYDMAATRLGLSMFWKPLVMIAIGKPASKEVLTPELQAREFASDRVPLHSIISEGVFSKEWQ